MTTEAPEFPSAGDETPSENPFARQLAEIRRGYNEVRKAIDESEGRVMAAIIDVGHRIKRVEMTQAAWEGRILALEQWRRDTEPCPPPSGAE